MRPVGLDRVQPWALLGQQTIGAPAFNIVSACVTDIGGTFCHAAIVAREYKMPAVIGVGNGTAVITSGNRLRVDGDDGVVTILERAK